MGLAGRRGSGCASRRARPASRVSYRPISHLYGDHVGGLGELGTGAPAFPNAEVYLGAADWSYFVEREQSTAPLDPHTVTVLRHLDQVVRHRSGAGPTHPRVGHHRLGPGGGLALGCHFPGLRPARPGG